MQRRVLAFPPKEFYKMRVSLLSQQFVKPLKRTIFYYYTCIHTDIAVSMRRYYWQQVCVALKFVHCLCNFSFNLNIFNDLISIYWIV